MESSTKIRFSDTPKEPALKFGPVVERVINAQNEYKGSDAIDLAGGKLVDLPKSNDKGDFPKWSADEQGRWCADKNVDLWVEVVPSTARWAVRLPPVSSCPRA